MPYMSNLDLVSSLSEVSSAQKPTLKTVRSTTVKIVVLNKPNIHNDGNMVLSSHDSVLGLSEGTDVVGILKSCARRKDLHKGSKIHAEILKLGLLEKNIAIGNTLISMYTKCGALSKAHQVFDGLPFKTVVSWTALISGYAQHGSGELALRFFEKMQKDGPSPNDITLCSVLKACGNIRAIDKGKEIHSQIIKDGLLLKHRTLGTALVDMYAKCGALGKAQEVFDDLALKDVVSWTAIITGYVQHGYGEEALKCFDKMQSLGLSPDAFTFSSVLKACGTTGEVKKGKEIHSEISRLGILGEYDALGNALMDMYVKCGSLADAQETFDNLPGRNVISWNTLITGYCEHGYGEEALDCYETMQLEGSAPNAVTFACVLKTCGKLNVLDKGRQIHADIIRKGLLACDNVLGNALLDMYIKCDSIGLAQQTFDELPCKNVVSWTTLISGYCEHGFGEEALDCYEQMQREHIFPNTVTFTSLLKASGSIGAIENGKQLHNEIIRGDLLGKDVVLDAALVDMYAQCGLVEKAQEVFDELLVRDTVSWTALIAGYAQLGKYAAAIESFYKMVGEGVKPDPVTMTIVLNVCIFLGLVDEGQMIFDRMSTTYGMIPNLDNQICLVDLYAHAGLFEKAMAVIVKMPTLDYIPIWSALLSACCKLGNVKFGKLAFEHAIRLDETSAVPYICMSNIYAAAGMKDYAKSTDIMRRKNKAYIRPGHSYWKDVYGTVHSFTNGVKQHPQIRHINRKLEEITQKLRSQGYLNNLCVSMEDELCGHGDMLAISSALINTFEGAPIVVVNSLRICDSCHLSVSLISKVVKRHIIVKDMNHFHVFNEGRCSCGLL